MRKPGKTGVILGAIAAGIGLMVVVVTGGLIILQINQRNIALTEEWIVIDVVDGDRLTLRQADGKQINVRLCGIVAALNEEAKEKLISLVKAAENQVMLIPVEKDSDGYTVAEVMANGTGELDISFGEELLKSGLAKTRKSGVECPNQLSFEQAEKIGIATKVGVWK
ncbi:nuclease (plasmid) [Nostoc sp. NIES-3756]|uniref:thermonuclease family protein n=1 Tax=Nostoc sp. NIES-3756 TaxID=1751286 RepID=UPI00071FDD6E|nr:thermonuclease family protein [Nostoc sp. NIES-3756]BAT56717.1 nuclease [Nostoc sp. NIES-3756]BAY41617.1 nuclease [Nostoc sp. NIES-2111]